MTQAPKGMFDSGDLLAGSTPTSQPMPGEPETVREPEPPKGLVEKLTAGKEMKAQVPIVNGSLMPADLDALGRVATMVMQSGMAPQGVSCLADACIVIMAGMEAGLSLGMTLKNVMVVNRRPAIWGDAALALVRRSILCVEVDEKIEGTGDNAVAVCTCRRKGQELPVVRRFGVEDAKVAGLWMKTGTNGKPTPWVTYPLRMLQMRARGFALRDAFPDLLMGLAIVEEELDVPAFNADRMVAAAPVLTDNAAGREIAAALPREGVPNVNQ